MIDAVKYTAKQLTEIAGRGVECRVGGWGGSWRRYVEVDVGRDG